MFHVPGLVKVISVMDVVFGTSRPGDLFFHSHCIDIIKRDMFVCMLPMAGRTAGPIKTKLGIGTHVDPKIVLVKVKVKVI